MIDTDQISIRIELLERELMYDELNFRLKFDAKYFREKGYPMNKKEKIAFLESYEEGLNKYTKDKEDELKKLRDLLRT